MPTSFTIHWDYRGPYAARHDRALDVLTGWPELNGFKPTSIPR